MDLLSKWYQTAKVIILESLKRQDNSNMPKLTKRKYPLQIGRTFLRIAEI